MKPFTPPCRVIVADTNALFRSGLRVLLSAESELQVVGEASTEEELISLLYSSSATVALVQTDRLAIDSAVLDRIAAEKPQLRFVFLTTQSGLSAGVILRKVKEAALAGEAAAQTADLQALADANSPAGSPDPLTRREREVVRLLAEGMTVREVARALELSAKTVEAHTLNLMRKLKVHDRASVIEYAAASGLVSAA